MNILQQAMALRAGLLICGSILPIHVLFLGSHRLHNKPGLIRRKKISTHE